jgi:hypothetical protein
MLQGRSTVSQWSGQDKAHAILQARYKTWQKDPRSKYYGKSKRQILSDWTTIKNDAMKMGTRMHELIEATLLGDLRWIASPEDDMVWKQFTAFVRDHAHLLVPQIGVEVMVEHPFWRLTGRIDFVGFDLEKSGYILLDWKRAKASPDPIQLNMYKLLLEADSPFPVLALYAVQFHPTLDTYQLTQIPIVEKPLSSYLGKAKHTVLRFHWNVACLVIRFVLKIRHRKHRISARPDSAGEDQTSDWQPFLDILSDMHPSRIPPWI